MIYFFNIPITLFSSLFVLKFLKQQVVKILFLQEMKSLKQKRSVFYPPKKRILSRLQKFLKNTINSPGCICIHFCLTQMQLESEAHTQYLIITFSQGKSFFLRECQFSQFSKIQVLIKQINYLTHFNEYYCASHLLIFSYENMFMSQFFQKLNQRTQCAIIAKVQFLVKKLVFKLIVYDKIFFPTNQLMNFSFNNIYSIKVQINNNLFKRIY
eukprot:TRINITY_DN8496_c1_g1_i4.p1 TRINITY_DN8496_c1_g1~~TRINITY_DN8496_c1_g1_i4.p1  ORF type:complete len:212 (-),score=-20.63 TRINITY_DN8496_c1_g1_i4:157-792(-)